MPDELKYSLGRIKIELNLHSWHMHCVALVLKVTEFIEVEQNIRRQLTLFVDESDAETIEQIRQEFNPVQSGFIKCHVTLCREDELVHLDQVISNLIRMTDIELAIEFGKVIRLDNGKGLILPVIKGAEEFQELRKQVLHGVVDTPRFQEPHITLMHSRNSTCTDSIFERIKKIPLPRKISFKKISLIEQVNGGSWKILREFDLEK